MAAILQTLFQMLFLAAVHANASFKALLETLHLFSDTPLYGHMVATYINFNEFLEYVVWKFKFQ